MELKEAVRTVLVEKYSDFNGRARRSEYWYWTLFNVVVALIASAIASVLKAPVLASIWSIAVLIPSLAVCIRRLHDIGKSGWYYLFILIPIVGLVLLLVWFTRDSQPGSNQYGENPKGIN